MNRLLKLKETRILIDQLLQQKLTPCMGSRLQGGLLQFLYSSIQCCMSVICSQVSSQNGDLSMLGSGPSGSSSIAVNVDRKC